METKPKRKPKAERSNRKCLYCDKATSMLPKQKFCSDSCRAGYSRDAKNAEYESKIAQLEEEVRKLRGEKPT